MRTLSFPNLLPPRWRLRLVCFLGLATSGALVYSAIFSQQSKVIRNQPVQANPAAVVQQATEDYDAIRIDSGALLRQLRSDLVRIEANRLIAEATKQTQNKGPAEAPFACYGLGLSCGINQFEKDAITALELALKQRNHPAAMQALLKIEALDIARVGAMPVAEPDWQVPVYSLLKRATARNLNHRSSPVGQMDAALEGRVQVPASVGSPVDSSVTGGG